MQAPASLAIKLTCESQVVTLDEGVDRVPKKLDPTVSLNYQIVCTS